MYVEPGAQYPTRLALGPTQTGLVGTVRVRLLDNDLTVDDPIYGPSTAGIIEDPSGSGVYLFIGTAPSVVGIYNPAWDLGPGTELFFDDALIVTTSTPTAPVSSGHDYISNDHLKATLELQGMNFADVDLDSSIGAASRAVDDITGRRFWADDDTTIRTYIPRWSRVEIDDAISIDEVQVSGVTLTEGTDYVLLPLNAVADGVAFDAIQFLSWSPTWFGLPVIAVTGRFGWPAVPDGVVVATTILATRLLRRQREAPFGIVMVGIEQGAVARIGREDPDVQNALCKLTRGKVMIGLG